MSQIQFINISPEQLQNEIIEGVKTQLEDLKKFYQPKEPAQFVTRKYVMNEMLHCSTGTLHKLTVKGVLTKYQCGGKILFLRSQVEEAIVKINN